MGSRKFDEGKHMMSLIEPPLLFGVAEIMTFGASKYGRDNWKESAGSEEHDEFVQRVKDALLRHLYAYLDGEKIDPESGSNHLYHAVCNIMFLEYYDRHRATVPVTHCTESQSSN